MLTAGACVLLVHPDGSTSFSFDNEMGLPEVRTTPQSGAGIYLPTHICEPPSLSDSPLTRLGVGKYKTHLCFQCFCVIAKGTRAKQRVDCAGLSFCSTECLERGSACLDLCSAYLFALAPAQGLKPQPPPSPPPPPQSDVSSGVLMGDLKQLALLACCNAILGPGNQNMQSLHLTLRSAYCGPDGELEPGGDVLAAADDILAFAQSPQGRGKLRRFLVDGLGRAKLARLLAAIKFNAQALPVLQLPGTSVLCFLPTLSKLNHSCAPNSVLVREDAGCGALPFTVRLQLIERGPFPPGELTISYLANLCCSRRDRQALLRAAFSFHCRCSRCEAETGEDERGGEGEGDGEGAWLSAAMSERDWRADTIAAALEAVMARVLSPASHAHALSARRAAYAAHPLLLVLLQHSMRLRDNRLVGRCTAALVRLLEMRGGGVLGQPGVVELLARGAEAVWAARGAGSSDEELAGGRDLAQRALRYLCDWHGRDATAAPLRAHVQLLCSRYDSCTET